MGLLFSIWSNESRLSWKSSHWSSSLNDILRGVEQDDSSDIGIGLLLLENFPSPILFFTFVVIVLFIVLVSVGMHIVVAVIVL